MIKYVGKRKEKKKTAHYSDNEDNDVSDTEDCCFACFVYKRSFSVSKKRKRKLTKKAILVVSS